mgnify:FL=1
MADIFRQRVIHRGHRDGGWSGNQRRERERSRAGADLTGVDDLVYDATRQG